MDFVSAVKETLKDKDKWMNNMGAEKKSDVIAYKPAGMTEGFLVAVRGTESVVCLRWQPEAEDILSDAWAVVEAPDVFN